MVDSYRLYGQAMLDYLRGERGKFHFVRDNGLRDPADVKSLFAPSRKWLDAEKPSIQWMKGRVLDVGCGAGRVALYVQRRGHGVTAIDVSPEAVECARLRGVWDVRVMNARHLAFPRRSFDTVVMFGNNFGICGDVAATKRFLRRAWEITRRHGRLIAATRTPASWMKEHLAYLKENVRHGRPPGLISLRIEYKGKVGTWFPLLLVSPDDLLRICRDTGWDVREIIPNHGGILDYAFVAKRR